MQQCALWQCRASGVTFSTLLTCLGQPCSGFWAVHAPSPWTQPLWGCPSPEHTAPRGTGCAAAHAMLAALAHTRRSVRLPLLHTENTVLVLSVGSLRICAAWAEISLPNCAAADVRVGLVKASSWLVL